MTDLTYCYLHMTRHDLQILDTLETAEYLKGELSDDELDIPPHMIPPNPDDTDILPSRVHPSYPYGNPTSIKHPAARPRPPYDPTSRALFEDMGYGGGGINGALRWRDLGLDLLLPINEEKEQMKKAEKARRMASGAASNHPAAQGHQQRPVAQEPSVADDEEEGEEDDEGEEEDDEDEDDEDDEDEVEEGDSYQI